jgi:hypothetical protein
MQKQILMTGLLVVGLATSAWAATPGTAALDPFDLGTSAAISAMGGASAAAPGGLWSLGFNPAGLADVNERQIGGTYLKWIEGSNVSYGAVALPPGFALGAIGWDQGSIKTTSGYAWENTNEKVSDFGAIAGYGTKLPSTLANVSVGISGQFWQKNYAGSKASTFGVNFGGRYMAMEDQLTVGAYVQNIGPAIKFETDEEDKQPMTMTGGLGWMMKKADSQMLRFGAMADVVKPLDQGVYFAAGAQVILQDILSLRGGLSTVNEETTPTFGVGILYKAFGFDYSFANIMVNDESLATHRISISFALVSGQ